MYMAEKHHNRQSWGKQFAATFGRPLKPYLDARTGFDVIKFDEELIKPPDGQSCEDVVREQHGEDAVTMIKSLISGIRKHH
jgi:hypothetical protein